MLILEEAHHLNDVYLYTYVLFFPINNFEQIANNESTRAV